MDHYEKIEVDSGGERGDCMKNNREIQEEDIGMDLRRGPWTVEEDFTLINFIAHHGEGRWNSLARCAGKYLYFLFVVDFLLSCLSNIQDLLKLFPIQSLMRSRMTLQ